MPYLYLTKYIFFPLISCITSFILVNFSNTTKYLSLNNLILIYIFSLIFMCVSPYLICLTVCVLSEISEFCPYFLTKIRDSIFPVLHADSDSETSSLYSNVSRGSVIVVESDSDRLNKSLNEIEKEMEVLDNRITSLLTSIKAGDLLQKRYNILSKVLLYIPVKGQSLFDVFSEASLVQKNDLLVNRIKLAYNRAKFHELRGQRLEVLDKLAEND